MRSRSARLWQFVALTVFGLAAASAFMMMSVGARSGAQSSPAARLGRRIGEIPAIAKPEAFQGYLSGTESIPMIISFEPRNQGALQKLLADLYSRGSEQYHHWISAKEFGSRFGRTEAEFNRAESWLKDQGFEIDQAFDNRLDIAFTGTADAVQRAFDVQMGKYWDAANNRSFYSNMQSPTLPPDIY
ncbi:MAG TPA: protease pro-enzyme activation domain-containing protein, partial [Blastocatellia bacterium]|nr:protease pro-enzyme activation domain-containing protein [Blastocatellia bacterium]